MANGNVGPCAALLILFAGCGSDGPGTGPLTEAQARPYCEQICQQDIDCGSTQTLEECATECSADISGPYRGDAVETMADCIAGLTCKESQDICFQQVEPLDVHRQFEEACTAKFTECGGLEPAEIQSLCDIDGTNDTAIFKLITPSVMEQINACFEGACDAIFDCIQTVAAENGLDL